MKIMDRYLLINFLLAFTICFSSLVGLYVIIDLFSNADEFLEDHPGMFIFVRRAFKYYFVHSFEYYGRLSPIITQIAAMATLAQLHRQNEVVAILAAGVPTRRVLVPILMGACLTIGFGVVNREMILPELSEVLQRMHEDIEADKTLLPSMQIDRDQVLFRATFAEREELRLDMVNVTLPMEVVGTLQEVRCDRAYNEQDPQTGNWGWRLVNATPVQILQPTGKVKKLENGELFVFSNVTFWDMIRRPNWTFFASTFTLVNELGKSGVKDPAGVRILIHNRLMHPVLNFILVLIGVPFVLQWERKNIYRSIAVSMLLSALFFMFDTTSGYFASYGYLDEMTAAWLPVLVFGPIAMSLMHRIGT